MQPLSRSALVRGVALALTLASPLAAASPTQGPLRPGVPQTAPGPAPRPALEKPGPPGPPTDIRLTHVDGHLRLEWDRARGARGYRLYVGETPNVGPDDHASVTAIDIATCWVIDSLSAGDRVFIAISSVSDLGEGPTSASIETVYGPRGIVSGHAVQRLDLGGGESFFVDAAGARVSLLALNDPVAEPIVADAGEAGRFRLTDVLEGSYAVSVTHRGLVRQLATPVDVTSSGLALEPLEVEIGASSPPLPGEVLVGTLRMSGGQPARIERADIGIDERSEVFVQLPGGERVSAVPDRRGRFALVGIPQAAYPLTVEAAYQGLVTHVEVPNPPQQLVPLRLEFPEPLPRVTRIRALQGGHEVRVALSGQPVQFTADFDDPGVIQLDPCWVAEFNGEVQIAAGPNPTFVFQQPVGPAGIDALDGQSSGTATIGLLSTKLLEEHVAFELEVIALPFGVGCWSGTVGTWHPNAPDDITAGHPATVSITHTGVLSPTGASSTPVTGGYFETNLDPTLVPPYLVRVEKPDHMPFLWPFEFRLPLESTFCVVPADVFDVTSDKAVHVIEHESGARLTIPNGDLQDMFSTPWFGNFRVQMVVLDWEGRAPWPPTPEVEVGTPYRSGIHVRRAVWFDITTPTGMPLFPTAASKLVFPAPPSFTAASSPAYHQVESTGYFERYGYGLGIATMIAPGEYEIPLADKGLFLMGDDRPLNEVALIADRSLNYPFDVLSTHSIFPVSVRGPMQNDLGRLHVTQVYGIELDVLDLRFAPGNHFTNVMSPGLPLEPMKKPVIVKRTILPPLGSTTSPILGISVGVSMATSEPSLKDLPTDSTVASINTPTHFLSRGGVNSASDAWDYYTRIQAPPTLAAWRALNGLPVGFGDPITKIHDPNDYATAYYYNLGDLGFARAQTMRIREGVDSGRDVAFAVTNYRTLEAARCGRSSIATVCMDYAARKDLGASKPTRYTRFYVYGSDGNLLACADLDGGGSKCVPNLCVTCHGGRNFTAGDSTDLGSRFLPFDLESYAYHPKFGVQHEELAKMNAGVLETNVTVATQDLIEGWYGTTNPLASPLNFFQSYVPTAPAVDWSPDAPLYADMFKAACRVCHNSRETSPGVQFDTQASLASFGFGQYPACTTLDMPHAQRTWGAFWGSRCAVNLGAAVPDMPTKLGTAAGTSCR